MTLRKTAAPPRENPIAQALQGLADGLYAMFSRRLDLLHYELIEESKAATRRLTAVVIGGLILAFGYITTLVALVLTLGAIFDALWVMALATGVIGLAHVAAGTVALRRGLNALAEQKFDLDLTRDEFQKDRQWLKTLQTSDATGEAVAAPARES